MSFRRSQSALHHPTPMPLPTELIISGRWRASHLESFGTTIASISKPSPTTSSVQWPHKQQKRAVSLCVFSLYQSFPSDSLQPQTHIDDCIENSKNDKERFLADSNGHIYAWCSAVTSQDQLHTQKRAWSILDAASKLESSSVEESPIYARQLLHPRLASDRFFDLEGEKNKTTLTLDASWRCHRRKKEDAHTMYIHTIVITENNGRRVERRRRRPWPQHHAKGNCKQCSVNCSRCCWLASASERTSFRII